MVLTSADYEFRECIHETRIWSPKYGTRLSERPWVGKPVHVEWQAPVFERCGAMYTDRGIEMAWLMRWYAFVPELNRQVPGDELLHTPKGT